MRNPYAAMLKATRMAKKGRPLSAALLLQQLVLPNPKPRLKRVKVPRRSSKQGLPRSGSVAQRPERPPPGSFMDGRFQKASAELRYKLYTPIGSARRRMPLVVMLHGCGQTAADFAAGSGMNALADELGFLVLYPEQSVSANMARCWNWHRPRDQRRGSGEPALIAALTLHAIAAGRVNPARVYIAGISAGGATAAIVGAAYPEIFAAVGVHSGLAQGDVDTLSGAVTAMRTGVGSISSGRTIRPLPTIIFHGDKDRIVHPSNAAGFLSQLKRSRPGSLTHRVHKGQVAGGRSFTRTLYTSGDGKVLLEDWIVHGSGHAWSGGKPAGSHTDAAGPDASREMIRFFGASKRSLVRARPAPTSRRST